MKGPRFAAAAAALCAATLTTACSKNNPPEIHRFEITTLPVTRGEDEYATVDVEDDDTLKDLHFRFELSGPAQATFDIPGPNVLPDVYREEFQLFFLLATQAPPGTYEADLVAIDADDNESSAQKVTLDVQ